MIYKLKVCWENDDGNQDIELGGPGAEQDVINETKLWIDTLDDKSKVKAKATLARLNIKGMFDPTKIEIKKAVNAKLSKIFEWATDFKNNTTYRKVIVEIYEDSDNIYRKYEIDRMFVRDYKETFHSGKNEDCEEIEQAFFELDLTQLENQWDKLYVMDN